LGDRGYMFQEEFIFESAPFKECHASTIAQSQGGRLLAAWFGGTREGESDVGIWLSTKTSQRWSEPLEVVKEPGVPCWNPVLFAGPDGVIWLFFKVGSDPRAWSGAFIKSFDEGQSWTNPAILPAGLLGPIKNKPVLMSNGKILFPTSVEAYRAWTAWVEVLEQDSGHWTRYGPIVYPGVNMGLIQPTVVEISAGNLKAFLRATRTIGAICVAESHDFGETWSPARKTPLPNPNAGIDVVRLGNGHLVMIYNHSRTARTPLNAALSLDGGETWGQPRVLENEEGEYSYPAVIQTRDGLIHTVYTHKRKRIKHCVFDESWLEG